jgi:SSS family solute:Na+ symporter
MLAGIGIWNLLVIAVYFAIIIGIGLRASRHVKNQEDYFLAGRKFGKFIQTFTAFGTGTNVESPVGVATTTYTDGAAGIWSSLVYLFVTPIYWLIAPWMRRLRLLTMADYFEERYGSKAIAGLYTLVAALLMTTHLAVGFSAASKTVLALVPKDAEQLTDAERAELERSRELRRLEEANFSTLSAEEKTRLAALTREAPHRFFSHINPHVLIWIICGVVIVYGMAGGLEAAALTDALQGMSIILMTVILFPFCWARINDVHGGSGVMDALETVHRELPECFFQVLGSPTLMDFTWFYVLALSVMTICNTPPQAHFLTSLAAARNEYA